MEKDTIKSLTRIGRSLLGDLERSFAVSEDALTTVSLLELNEERTLERASRVMLERAERAPVHLLSLQHPFYRLSVIERFLLTALHIEKWSYERVGRVLNVEPFLIESLAWSARLKIIFDISSAAPMIEYPRAPTKLGPVCPEYNLTHPWTQKMLDDELGKREQIFLQNHLMGCTECRKSLNLTRNLFYKVESMIPVKDAVLETEFAVDQIYQNWKAGESAFRPIKTTFAESMIRFLNQPKIQFSIAGLVLLYIFWK